MINPVVAYSEGYSQPVNGVFTSAAPVQQIVAGMSPALLRAVGAAYCYYVAQKVLVKGSDPQKNLKLAAFTAAGLYAPVLGSMGLLLYANMRKG